MKLKNLVAILSDEEIRLLIDGLENLPHKDVSGDIMETLISTALLKDPIERARMEREREEKRRVKEGSKEQLKNKIRMLQGKILMMKEAVDDAELGSEIDDLVNPKV